LSRISALPSLANNAVHKGGEDAQNGRIDPGIGSPAGCAPAT
jgi:hypothetical protein